MSKTRYQGHIQLILAKGSKPSCRAKKASLWEKSFWKAYTMQRSARYEKQFNAKK